MPAGYLKRQTIDIESLPPSGTIVYDTFSGPVIGTVTGAIVYAQDLQMLDSVAIIGTPYGYAGSKVVGFGLGLGTIVGSVTGTVAPASNLILFKLYNVEGTVGATSVVEPAQGTNIAGQVLVLERGV